MPRHFTLLLRFFMAVFLLVPPGLPRVLMTTAAVSRISGSVCKVQHEALALAGTVNHSPPSVVRVADRPCSLKSLS